MATQFFLIFIFCLYYNSIFKSKLNKVFAYILSLVFISIIFLTTHILIKDLFLSNIIKYILTLGFSFIFFEDKPYTKIYINNNIFLILFESKIIVYSVFSIIRGDSISNIILNNDVTQILNISSLILFLVIALISIKIWNDDNFSNLKQDKIYMGYLNIITIILLFVMLGLEYFISIQNNVYFYSYYALFLVIITGIGNSIFINSLDKLSKNTSIENELNVLQQQMQFQIQHYENYEKHIQETRRLWHDINNHFSVINILMIKKDYTKAEDYINSLSGILPSNTLKVICNHKVLDALLVSKIKECEEKNINFEIDINISNEVKFNNIDLCCIFGNLINNAIESCDKVKNNKYIYLKAKIKQGYLIISIKNPYEHNLNFKNFKFSTTKSDKLNHGIGLNSIQKSVNKYDGHMEIITKNNIFSTTIVMKEPN